MGRQLLDMRVSMKDLYFIEIWEGDDKNEFICESWLKIENNLLERHA